MRIRFCVYSYFYSFVLSHSPTKARARLPSWPLTRINARLRPGRAAWRTRHGRHRAFRSHVKYMYLCIYVSVFFCTYIRTSSSPKTAYQPHLLLSWAADVFSTHAYTHTIVSSYNNTATGFLNMNTRVHMYMRTPLQATNRSTTGYG